TCGNENRAESQAEVDAKHKSLDAPDGYGSMDEDDHTISNGDEEEFEGKRKRKPPPQKGCKRQKFTEVETEEIKTYFSEYLKSGICPRKQQVEDAKQKSCHSQAKYLSDYLNKSEFSVFAYPGYKTHEFAKEYAIQEVLPFFS
ncbi:hypothetical protein DPMN_043674, partial [Dreissena polymorpha]